MARSLVLYLLLVLTACTGDSRTAIGPTEDRIVRSNPAEIKTLDPQLIFDLASANIAWDQYEGLTRLSADGIAEPGLASDWTVSGDGLRWRFRLRPDIRFSDGTAITAATFEGVFRRLNDPAEPIPNRALFEVIANMRADGGTVEVILNAPFPHLPDLLAQPALAAVPLHRIAAKGEQWTAERPLVTSGAYRLAEWRLNDHIRLEPNPHWHGGAPPVSTVIWQPMDDALSAMRQFLAGESDIVDTYPAARHGWLQQQRPGAVHSTPTLATYYFTYNIRKPPFNDRRIRLALAMTVEREWIADKVMAIGNQPAWGLLPPGLTDRPLHPEWADWPREKRLARARQLLAAAGYGPDRPLRFAIRFNSSPEHRRVAVAMAAMWEPLGVEASLFNTEAALHFSALHDHDFTLARSGWIADIPAPENFLSVHVRANGDGNYSGYASDAYESRLAAAQQIGDPEKRAAAMRAAEEILIADMPIIPLYYYVSRSLVAPRIDGWVDNASNVHPSRTLAIR